jgi:prepilin-type processing-associated H-X9-DG protein
VSGWNGWQSWGGHPAQGSYQPWRTKLSAVLCPSDSAGFAKSDTSVGGNNYVFSWGDHINFNNSGNRPRGAFGRYSSTGFRDILDGTSTTLMFSETVMSDGTGRRDRVHGGYAIVGGLTGNPAACLAVEGNSGQLTGTLPDSHDRRGNLWPGGWPMCTGFNTVLAPNAPNCANGKGEWNYGVFTPDSFHPGGVNATFCDGSVTFIADSIDTGNVSASDMAGKAGPSPYGVWGRLGSRAGGEEVEVP